MLLPCFFMKNFPEERKFVLYCTMKMTKYIDIFSLEESRMKNSMYLILMVLAGICGAILRGICLLHGYEAKTGLLIEGYQPAIILAGLTVGILVIAWIVSRIGFKKYNGCSYEQLFGNMGKGSSLLCALASVGMMVCSAYSLTKIQALMFEQSVGVHGEVISPNIIIVIATALIWVLGLLSGLFLLILSVRQMTAKQVKKINGICVTIPMFWCCLDLIMIYHENSGNPIISEYSYLMFVVIGTMMTFYSIATFLFSANISAVRYFTCAGIAIYLACTHIGGNVLYALLSNSQKDIVHMIGLGNTMRLAIYTCTLIYLLVFFVHALRQCKKSV